VFVCVFPPTIEKILFVSLFVDSELKKFDDLTSKNKYFKKF